MTWVFDASITMAWCFDDEKTAKTESLFDRLAAAPATVPQIWPLEVGNVLVIAMRKSRISPAKRSQFIATLAALPIVVDPATFEFAMTSVLTLADQHQLTTYDAAYLELAMRHGIPLATLDSALHKAAEAA